MMQIGVLALQGAFAEHIRSFARLEVSAREVRLPSHLKGLSGLVIPGGESTTISHLLDDYALFEPVKAMVDGGIPVWGTCAGLILLARRTTDLNWPILSAIDIAVRRNGIGRQVDSFETDLEVVAFGAPRFRAIFIRSPVITAVGAAVQPLASLDDGTVVAAREGNVLVTSFHPELTEDFRFHRYFVEMATAAQKESAQKGSMALTAP